ncbi:MAG: hypothetical protein KIT69_10340 [Propionibacteriaceae bacterium]|nr:hypothetical protein [Propionibacteriaceae bacterium]
MTEPVLPPVASDLAKDALVLPPDLRRRRPASDAELAALIRDLLVHWGVDPQLVRAVEVDAELAGAEVARLRLSASGISLPSLADPPEQPLPGGVDEVAGRLEEFQLLGRDLRWERAAFDVAVQAHGVPLRWLMQDGRLVGIGVGEEDAAGSRGSLRLETEVQPLVESIRLTLNRQLGRHGVQVRKLRARASELGERTYRVSGEAAIRWKVLPLSARLSMVATIDGDLTLRFSDVQVSSLNPLCAAVFAFTRRQIREGFAAPIPLRESFGLQLTDLTLRVEPRLLVEASFADLR